MSTTNTINDLFVIAARKKFRFDSNRGQILTEDLFDASLNTLDNIAVELDDKIQKAGRKSFVEKRAASTTELEYKLEIVKFVIETKQAEEEAKKTRKEKAEQKAFLHSLLEKKKIEALEGMSEEEIKKKLAEIEG